MNNPVSKQEIRSLMENPELSERITVYKELVSTNKTAKELVQSDNAPHGTVIIALNQTGAYGRRERAFYTYPGGVYLSVVVRIPPAEKNRLPENAPLITAYAAVAVCNAVYAVSGKVCAVKWVNDVFLGGKKICGILTEAISGTDAAIVGIGVNLIPFSPDVPEYITEIAGTVFNEGESIPLNVKNRFAADVIEALTAFGFDGASGVLEEYKKHCSALFGKEITVFENSGEKYKATAIDIDEKCRLIVEDSRGGKKILSSGEISVKL